MSAAPDGRPTEEEIEEYLTKDLWLRGAGDEPAEEALEANYQLGLRLREAINFKYPPPAEPPAKIGLTSKLARGVKTVVTIVVAGALGWAAYAYFGSAAVPYVAAFAVLVAYGHLQTKIEDLEMKVEVLGDVFGRRIKELEAVVKAPERQRLLDDFESARSIARSLGSAVTPEEP